MKQTTTLVLAAFIVYGTCLLVQKEPHKSQEVSQLLANEPHCYIYNCDDCSSDALVCKKCSDPSHCCSNNCKQCTASICSQCLDSYNLTNNLCVPRNPCQHTSCKVCDLNFKCIECEKWMYLEPRINQCLDCPKGCTSCEGIFNCTSCMGGYFFKNFVCQKCSDECSQCNETECLECYLFFGLYKGKCVKCFDTACVNCTKDATSCNQCTVSHFLYKDHTCHPCGASCNQCKDYESCDKCDPQYWTYYNVSQHACVYCPYSCFQCTKSTICDGCRFQGHYLNPAINPTMCFSCQSEECKYCLSNNNCKECQRGLASVQGKCLKCSFLTQDMQCSACIFNQTTSQTRCQICSDGYYLNEGKCNPCQSNCRYCPNSTYCNNCSSYFRKIYTGECQKGEIANCQIYSGDGKCSYCEDKYHLVSTNDSCVPCQTINCRICPQDSSICSGCQIGFFVKSNKCKPCISHCLYCEDNIQTCWQCQKGYYTNNQENACKPCEEGCLSCSMEDFGLDVNCLQCAQGYTRTNVNGRVGQVCLKASESSQVNQSPKSKLFSALKELLLNL